MDEDILVHVDINVGGDITSSTQVVPLNIAWEDFELMLKVYADQESIDVYYKDDEDELIRVSSQEELEIALMLAKSGDNTLCLKVFSMLGQPMDGRNANTAEMTEPDGSDGCLLMGEPAPRGPPSVEYDSRRNLMEEEWNGQSSLAVAAAKYERDQISPRRCFFLKHEASGFVLDVAEYSNKPGTPVILYGKKQVGLGNQLWYFHESTSTLHSQFCNLCLEVSETGSQVNTYRQGCPEQQWRLEGNRIRHASRSNWVVGATGSKVSQGSKVIACNETEEEKLNWTAQYIHIQPGCRRGRKPNSDCHQTSTNSHSYYTDLAQSVAQMMFGAPGNSPGSPEANQTTGNQGNSESGAMGNQGNSECGAMGNQGSNDTGPRGPPPVNQNAFDLEPQQWLLDCMKELHKDMVDQVSNAVASKTTQQILKGLEGAVITSVQGSSGIMQPPPGPPPSDSATQQQRTIYHHYGIICDRCEKTIVGVRYKCGNCEDYDLCGDCEATVEGFHPSDHIFLKIYRPVMNAGRKKDGGMVPLLKYNIYLHAEKIGQALQTEGPLLFKKEEAKQTAPPRPQHKDPIEKLKRKQEKLRKKVEKTEEKIKKKEKRRLGEEEVLPEKKEKLELPQFRVPDRMDAEFVCDVTINDGTHMQAGTRFSKKWTVRNTGTSPWTAGTRLMMIWGNMKPIEEEVEVPYTQVGEEVTITTEMLAPPEPGTYQSHWRLSYCGLRFGQRVWCCIVVDPQAEDTQRSAMADLDLGMLVPQKDMVRETPTRDTESPTGKQVEDSEALNAGAVAVTTTGDKAVASDTQKLHALPKPSQTATPNNTPLESRDVTPPHTPCPEELESERIWTLSDRTTPDLGSEHGSEGTAVSAEVLSECMAKMELKPPDVDLESLDSLSSDIDTDTDEDFYVVPIPDCFNPTLPASKESSTALYIKKEETQPRKLAEEADSMETAPYLERSGPECEYQPLLTEEPESPADEARNLTEETIELEPLQKVPTETCTNQSEQDSEPTREQETGESAATKPQERVQEVRLTEEVKERSTEGQGQGTTQEKKQEVGQNNQHNVAASNLVATAIDMASKATSTAVNTCKGVFNTLQGKPEQYIPPQSQWAPKESTWTPSKEEWTPQANQWTPPSQGWSPPQDQWQPPAPHPDPMGETPDGEASQMQQLIEMGFANRQLNADLLARHGNNLEKVVQELLSSGSMDWHVNRH